MVQMGLGFSPHWIETLQSKVGNRRYGKALVFSKLPFFLHFCVGVPLEGVVGSEIGLNCPGMGARISVLQGWKFGSAAMSVTARCLARLASFRV